MAFQTTTAVTLLLSALVVTLLQGARPAHSWKQLTPPTSFSITQQHPAAASSNHQHPTQHVLNSLGHDDHIGGTGGAHSSSSITFGGPTVSTSIGHNGPTYSTAYDSSDESSSGGSASHSGGSITSSSSSSAEEDDEVIGNGSRQGEGRILHHSGGGSDSVYESNYYGDIGAPVVSRTQRVCKV